MTRQKMRPIGTYSCRTLEHIEIRADILDRALREMPEFDLVVGTGTSGVMLVTALKIIGYPGAILRKANDTDHHQGTRRIFGFCSAPTTSKSVRYVVVDDLVASGGTVREVQRSIAEIYPMWSCIGVATCEPCATSRPESLFDWPNCEGITSLDRSSRPNAWYRTPAVKQTKEKKSTRKTNSTALLSRVKTKREENWDATIRFNSRIEGTWI